MTPGAVAAAVLRALGGDKADPARVLLHEVAHFVELADSARQPAAIRALAARKLSFDAVEDSNSEDLRVIEDCDDYRRGRPREWGDIGLRRVFRREVTALAAAEVAFPLVDNSPIGAQLAAEMGDGMTANDVRRAVFAAMATPRAQRLGRRLRRIVEGWAALGGAT